MIEKKLDYAGDVFFVDRETGAMYGNVVGGLGWPGAKPGFLVVAAISRVEDYDLEGFPITVIFEAGDSDVESLFRQALKFTDGYSCDEYFADMKNENMVQILDLFNNDRRRRGLKAFHPFDVPLIEDPNPLLFYLNLIRKYLRPNRKLLHFGPGSIFPGYLLNFSTEEAAKAKPADHPPIAALGLILSVLRTWRPRKEAVQVQAISEFDLFSDKEEIYETGSGRTIRVIND